MTYFFGGGPPSITAPQGKEMKPWCCHDCVAPLLVDGHEKKPLTFHPTGCLYDMDPCNGLSYSRYNWVV